MAQNPELDISHQTRGTVVARGRSPGALPDVPRKASGASQEGQARKAEREVRRADL